jgi:hypothetical protein
MESWSVAMAEKAFNTYFDQRPELTTGAAEYLLGKKSDDTTVKVYPTGRSSVLYPGVHYSLPAGYGAGTAAAFNDALSGASITGAGRVFTPPETIVIDGTIDNKFPRVLLGAVDGNNMLYSTTKTHSTTFVPSFAGTVLKHRTPYAAETGGIAGPRNDGGGFANIRVIGNSLATKLLEVDSVGHGTYRLVLDGCVGSVAAHFKCGVTGTDLSEATNIQHASIFLNVRQLDVGAARSCDCVWFEGSSNSNVCFIDDCVLELQHYDGDGLVGYSADNNIIVLRAYRPGGTGLPVIAKGPTASIPVGFEGNTFLRYSTNVAGYAEGTGDPGVIAGVTNMIVGLDNLNGTPVPTFGTGSFWPSITLGGMMRGYTSTGFVISDNTATAISERNGLGSKGLVIANGSESHLTLQNNSAAAKWLGRIINASGNFQMLRQAGTGYFDLGGVDAKMNALRITDGIAAPSAVTGQAQIYVDTADGDLKVIFADGTVKTIVVDT